MLRVETATDQACSRIEDRVVICEVPGGVAVVLVDGEAPAPVTDLSRRAISAPGFDHFSARAWAELLRQLDRECLPGEASAVAMAVWDRHIWGASVGNCSAVVAHEHGLDDLTENQMRWSRVGTRQARPVPFERGEWDGCVVVASSNVLGAIGSVAVGSAVFHCDVEGPARRLVQSIRASRKEQGADVTVATVWRGER